ncbi:MAG: prepilin-type N-terminal cleavage/methylation domain-containing protein [Coriobacteriales bacterium]
MTVKRGFTVAELLVVVAIIAVLVAVAIPIFSSQVEKSREATDLANVRSAYGQVMNAAILNDTGSDLYKQQAGTFEARVALKQAADNWAMDTSQLIVGGISFADKTHWKSAPKANGYCRVYYVVSEGAAYLNWGGEDHINMVSAKDFLTKEILTSLLPKGYPHAVINSNEKYEQDGGTRAFLDYARQNGFDLADYGAETWQIYVKDGNEFLDQPAIYWSTVKLEDKNMIGKYVPVMGYREGKYDLYYAQVVEYNEKDTSFGGGAYRYLSLSTFASVKNSGSGATFEYDTYEAVKSDYDKLYQVFTTKGTVESSDMNGMKNEKATNS